MQYMMETQATENGLIRAVLFEIDEDTGSASIYQIVQAENADLAIWHMMEMNSELRNVPIYAVANKDITDAFQIGNHWVVNTDELSLAEVCELLRKP